MPALLYFNVGFAVTERVADQFIGSPFIVKYDILQPKKQQPKKQHNKKQHNKKPPTKQFSLSFFV